MDDDGVPREDMRQEIGETLYRAIGDHPWMLLVYKPDGGGFYECTNLEDEHGIRTFLELHRASREIAGATDLGTQEASKPS